MTTEPFRIVIKPCKACGGAPEVTHYSSYFGETGDDMLLTDEILDDTDDIHCVDCGLWTGEHMTLREAIEWWNSQPLIEAKDAELSRLRAELADERNASRITDAALTGDLEIARNEIAKLRAELAAAKRWMPLDGTEWTSKTHSDFMITLSDNGRKLTVLLPGFGKVEDENTELDISFGTVRLCTLTPADSEKAVAHE